MTDEFKPEEVLARLAALEEGQAQLKSRMDVISPETAMKPDQAPADAPNDAAATENHGSEIDHPGDIVANKDHETDSDVLTGNEPAGPMIPAEDPVDKPAPAEKREPLTEFEMPSVGWILSRVGIAVLVIGIGSLLVTSYQHFGPTFKIATGFISALALVAGGEVLTRRKPELTWYGMGLIGGGWSVAYFAAYAMQNIASVQLMDNVLVNLCMLMGLAAGCMGHAITRKSETIALLSSILSFMTISLSNVSTFSVAASAVLIVGLAVVTIRMRWEKVFVFGTIASYATFFFFTQPVMAGGNVWVSLSFLTLYWASSNAVLFFLKLPEDHKLKDHIQIGVPVVNAIAFVALTLVEMGSGLAEYRYLFLLIAGGTYLALNLAASRIFSLPKVSLLFMLVGLKLATAAAPLKLDPEAVSAIWLIEVAFLAIAGLRFNILGFRVFALALGGVTLGKLVFMDMAPDTTATFLGIAIPWRVLLGCVGIASFATAANAYRQQALQAAKRVWEKDFYYFYLAAAGLVAWLLPAVEASAQYQPLFWIAQGVIVVALALVRSDLKIAIGGALFYVSSAISLLVNHDAVSVFTICTVIGVFYGTSILFRTGVIALEALHRRFAELALLAATMVLTFAITGLRMEAASPLALAWSVESAAVVALGFLLKDRLVRLAGSLGFGAVAFCLFAGYPDWTWLSTLPVLAIGFAVGFAFRYLPLAHEPYAKLPDEFEFQPQVEKELVLPAFTIAPSLALGLLFHTLLDGSVLSVAWAVQGGLLIAVGFLVADKYFRGSGLAVFVALVLKLFFVDLSGASWTEKTIAFVVTGLIFLASSFAYAWLDKTINPHSIDGKDSGKKQKSEAS